MSEDVESVQDGLERALLAYVRENYEGAALITGWVLVAEIMDDEGVPDLASFAAEGMPYWKINGLLDAAPDVMAYDYEDEDEDS